MVIFFHMERAPRNLASNLWVIDRPFKLPYVGVDIGTRMTCIRLADGRLFLHSPVKLDGVLRSSLDALGEVRSVVAPNKLHHLFLAEYITSYPRAIVYAAPSLSKKRPDLHFNGELGDEPQTEWRGQIKQHLFRGAPALNEVVFFHPATRTLILTDLAFNIPKEAAKRSPLFYWLWDVGHFGPHRFVRFRAIRDRQAARGSVETILSWNFDRIIVSHGEVVETDGHNQFAAAFAFLRHRQ